MGLCGMLFLTLQSFAVVTVADAAVTFIATGVKITATAVGTVADALLLRGD